jgi:putative membrane protein
MRLPWRRKDNVDFLWPCYNGCQRIGGRREGQQNETGTLAALPAHVAKEKRTVTAMLIQWLLYAVALLVVSKIVPGFTVQGLWPAMIASLVIGLLNATVGLFLKIVTFPLSILTLGLFLLVINGLMILVASSIVRGFNVRGFVPAFWGAVVLALLGMLIRGVTKNS